MQGSSEVVVNGRTGMFLRRLTCVRLFVIFLFGLDGISLVCGPDLRHALGARHVLVVVEREDHHVAGIKKLQEVPGELPVDKVVPRLRFPLHPLHELDLPVYEHGRGLKRVLRGERVRQLLFERAQPARVDRHACMCGLFA